jgi:hypothetical protein
MPWKTQKNLNNLALSSDYFTKSHIYLISFTQDYKPAEITRFLSWKLSEYNRDADT